MLWLIGAIDDLYERAVTTPADLDDDELGRWLEDIAAGLEQPVDPEVARQLRRAARNARRLVRRWTEHDSGSLPDWRNGVDDALGSKGWRVQFDLARRGLALDPDPELFEEARRRYRSVHFTDWPMTWDDIVGS